MELSSYNIKNFLMFSQKKAFVIFQETETPQNCFYIKKWNFIIFQEVTFGVRKMKNKSLLKSFLYFRKWNILVPSLKNF